MHRAGARETGPFPLGTLPGPPGTAGGLFRLLRRLGRRGRLNRGGFFLAPAQILFMLGLLRPALGGLEPEDLIPRGEVGEEVQLERLAVVNPKGTVGNLIQNGFAGQDFHTITAPLR